MAETESTPKKTKTQSRKTVTNFTIATDDEHPLNIDELVKHCDRYAYIRHDDPLENKPHTHFVGFLTQNTRTELKYISSWANVPENMIEIVRSKVGIVNYLTHKDEEEKVKYNPDKVQANFDWLKFVTTENAHIHARERLNEILNAIDNDEVIEYNVTDKLTMAEYVQYKKQIDLAFRYKNEKGNSEDRNMEVWYVHGKAGSGKTTLAKCLCKMMKMPLYIASQGKNPMDNYQGQPAVILDDARPSDWKFNDFLKLTDNNTSSMIGCRFYNKHFYRCRLLIVTSCMPLTEWYTNLQDHDGEAIEQLTRRFTRDIEVLETDTKKGIIQALDTESQSVMIFECPQIMKQVNPIDLFSLAKTTQKLNDTKQTEIDDLPW